MGEVIKFVPRAELERMLLDRAARTRDGGTLQQDASVGGPRTQTNEPADS